MLFVVVVLLATSVEGVVFRSSTARQGISTRDPGIGGFEFSDDLVFEMSARSASACSRRCLRFGGCEAFTFIKPSRTCRGHSSIPTPGSAKTSSSGAETWAWSVPSETSDTPTTVASIAEQWLDNACSTNADCPASNSECWKLKCLCTPGYYYSISSNNCVDDCSASDLQPSFVTYEQSRIIGNERYTSDVINLQACFDAFCNGYEWCRFVVYESANKKCYRYDQTPRDVSGAWDPNDSQFNSLQRKCA